jgi:hypothetical protein
LANINWKNVVVAKLSCCPKMFEIYQKQPDTIPVLLAILDKRYIAAKPIVLAPARVCVRALSERACVHEAREWRDLKGNVAFACNSALCSVIRTSCVVRRASCVVRRASCYLCCVAVSNALVDIAMVLWGFWGSKPGE